ncbi:MAG: DUF2252 family protein [Bacteriovoracaceae bacterium]|nr:DUF2252 family protein [Bacteriovoracaceae bacterium]
MKLLISTVIILLSTTIFATDATSSLSKIQSLYPHQSKEVILKRIKSSEDQFYFLRSFVPFYYDYISNNKSSLKSWAPLHQYTGFLAGDAHPQNFGTLINQESKMHFGVNDPDDGGYGPIYLDLLRYFTASNLMLNLSNSSLNTTQINVLLNAYYQGITDSKYEYSEFTRKLIEKSKRQGTTINPKWIIADGKSYKFKKRKNPAFTYDLSQKELISLRKILILNLKNEISILDGYGLLKYSGGSGGLNRFELLIQFEDKKLAWVELKQAAPKPGIFPISTKPLRSTSKRYIENINLQRGRDWLQYHPIIKLSGKPYLLRYRRDGNNTIDVDSNTPHSDFILIASDQLYKLGQLHLASSSNSYIQSLKKIKLESWLKDIKTLSQFMTTSFKNLTQSPASH